MPDDRVQVQIIADASGYVGGTKAAGQATDQLRVSAGQMAEALRQAGGDLSKINPALLGISAAAKEAAASISAAAPAATAATGAIAGAESAATDASAAMGGLNFATSGATQEFVRLGRAFAYGRLDMVPGEILTLASRTGGLKAVIAGLTPEVVIATGAIAGLGAVMIALAVSSAHTAEALGTARDAFSGMDVQPTDAQLGHLMDTLRQMPGATLESAEAVSHIFASMPQPSAEAAQAMADMLPEVMRRTGKDMVGAAKQMAQDWAGGFKDGAAPQQAAQFFFDNYLKTVQKLGAANQDAIMEALAGAGGNLGVSESLLATEQARVAASTQKDVAAAVKATASVYTASADELNRAADETAKRQETLLRWAQEYGARAAQINSEFATANEEAARDASTKAIEAARDKVAAISAVENMSATDRLKAQAAVWQALLAGDKLTADAQLEVRRTLNETLAELGRAQVAQATKNADEETQALRQQYERQMEIARQGAAEIKRLNEQQERANKEQAEQSSRDWNEAFSAIDGSMKTFLSDVISRNETAAAAAKSAIDKLVTSWITGIAEIMLKIVAFEALKAASGLGGIIGGVAASGAAALGGNAAVAPGAGGAGSPATGLAAILPGFLTSLLGIGRGVGAGSALPNSATDPGAQSVEQLSQLVNIGTQQLSTGTNALSAVTTSGSTLLGMATTAASGFAGIVESGAKQLIELILLVAKPSVLGTSYAVGTASVPHDMLAMVHKGEIVIPADISASLRNPQSMTVLGASAGNGAGSGAAPTGASTASASGHTFNFNVSAIDGPGVSAFFNKYGTSIARTVSGVSAANPSVAAPAY